jgi:prevent-host-death family protein
MKKKTVSIHQAKSTLSKLIQEVLQGEEIVIVKRNVPLIELVPVRNEKVKLGRYKGEIKISPDFDQPLEDFKEYM